MEMKIVKIDRYLHYKDGRIMDLLWKPYMLQDLLKIGIENEYISHREIMDFIGDSAKNRRRLVLLKLGGHLTFKKLKPDDKPHGTRYAYTLSGTSRKYLRKNKSFTNPEGQLMQKIFKKKFIETKIETKTEVKEIIKEVPVEKEIDFQSEKEREAEW